jgi:hypothetical protein
MGSIISQTNANDKTMGPMAAGQLDPMSSITTGKDSIFNSLLKEVLALRRDILGQMIFLETARKDYGYQQKHTSSSESHFMEASATFMAAASMTDPSTHTRDHLQLAWERLQKSKDNLKIQEERVNKLEKEIQKRYGRLLTKETYLYDQMQGMRNGFRASHGSESESDNASAPISAHSGSTVDMDPRASRYYDRLGDVNIYRERLFNFEMTHQQQIRIRQEQKELGLAYEMTDVEFYKQQLRERKALTEDILNATKEMKRLKRECDEGGIDVEEPETPPFADNNALDHLFRVQRGHLPYQIHPNSALVGQDPDWAFLIRDGDIKARVGHWLTDVQKAAETDFFDIATPESHTATTSSSTKLTKHVLTDKEADGLLAFPNYGMLNVPEETDSHVQRGGRLNFMADPPRRRYSESFNQIRRFDLKSLSCEDRKSSKSER